MILLFPGNTNHYQSSFMSYRSFQLFQLTMPCRIQQATSQDHGLACQPYTNLVQNSLNEAYSLSLKAWRAPLSYQYGTTLDNFSTVVWHHSHYRSVGVDMGVVHSMAVVCLAYPKRVPLQAVHCIEYECYLVIENYTDYFSAR